MKTPEEIGVRVVERLRAEGKLSADTIIAAVACNVPMSRLGEWTAPALRAAFAEAGYVVTGPMTDEERFTETAEVVKRVCIAFPSLVLGEAIQMVGQLVDAELELHVMDAERAPSWREIAQDDYAALMEMKAERDKLRAEVESLRADRGLRAALEYDLRAELARLRAAIGDAIEVLNDEDRAAYDSNELAVNLLALAAAPTATPDPKPYCGWCLGPCLGNCRTATPDPAATCTNPECDGECDYEERAATPDPEVTIKAELLTEMSDANAALAAERDALRAELAECEQARDADWYAMKEGEGPT